MSVPKYINREEMYSSVQIGASQVASILHMNPFPGGSAYELWQQKTGRIRKPEQTPAMKWGLDNEQRTIDHYFESSHIDPRSMQTQVCAQHRELPWLRCIADVWQESTGELIQVKSPSSPGLIKEMRTSGIPPHYRVQCLTEMAIFEADSEIFHVVDWTQNPPVSVTDIVSWDDFWDTNRDCLVFWEDEAIPALKAFWSCIEADDWPEGDYVQPEEKEWLKGVKMREDGLAMIERGERLKGMGDQKLKSLLGTAQAGSAAGWKATWVDWKPYYSLNIKCTGERELQEVSRAVEGLLGVDGVREIKPDIRPAKKVFRVDQLK